LVDDIIREIEEDLRSDRVKKLWQRYHKLAYAAVAVLVLGVAAYEFWQYREREARAAEGARFYTAMTQAEGGDAAAAGKTLEALARDAGHGYGILAKLYEADLLAKNGDVEGALKRYDAVAADGGVDSQFRDLAVLLGATLRVDRDDAASLSARLQPLLGDTNPWRFSARELVAVAALRAGNAAEARTQLQRLADDAAGPAGIRARAAELLKTLGES
jgi:hypothetical protein